MVTDVESRRYLHGTHIEIINAEIPRGQFTSVVFDFDGTLSLIREGWQNVMVPMFVDLMKQTGTQESNEELQLLVKEFVARLTGKQTIYQAIQLAEEIKKRGGSPKEPLEYKHQYLDLLWDQIKSRVEKLKNGQGNRLDHVIIGSYDLLDGLKKRECALYLASGTDLPYVLDEAATLEMDGYFGEHIYGALDDYKSFSKKMIIEKIIQDNGLSGPQLLTFGDGYVEIENTKEVGGVAIGVASDEAGRIEIDEWKRARLIQAGADVIIPNYVECDALLDFLFDTKRLLNPSDF